jgi:N-acetylglucosaminyldiphosphoundecaprenol N-acetyl-beta-D-mannosaminyltransferase
MNAAATQPRATDRYLLGTPLQITTYADWTNRCAAMTHEPRSTAVEFANTHIVALRRHDPEFRRMTDDFNFFIPDGMPLIWMLNFQGAGMRDRVYGPTFMRYFIQNAPEPFTHYLAGGTLESGTKLREVIHSWNPTQRVVGSFHGRCQANGQLPPDEEGRFLEEINRLAPDIVWSCFGAPKQELWLHHYARRIRRGVILSVGFALDVNAGTKKDAPGWMQKKGLTWIYRLCSEPRRLAQRYIKFNSLYLFYLFWDGIRGRAFTRPLRTSS